MSYMQGYDDDQGEILASIRNERRRQEELREAGRFKHTCASDALSHAERLSVLVEEVGEVSHEVNERINGERSEAALWDELVECGAVIVAWLEAIQVKHGRHPPPGAKRK